MEIRILNLNVNKNFINNFLSIIYLQQEKKKSKFLDHMFRIVYRKTRLKATRRFVL